MLDKKKTLEQIKKDVTENKIMVYMKGEKDMPMCGFSARAVEVFKHLGYPFKTGNVLQDEEFLDILEEYSTWPTSPQVFIDGELIGGCDITLEMYQSGELQKKLEEVFGAKTK